MRTTKVICEIPLHHKIFATDVGGLRSFKFNVLIKIYMTETYVIISAEFRGHTKVR